MDEKKEKPVRGWSQLRCVHWAGRVLLPTHSQGPMPSPYRHLTSESWGPWGCCRSVWVPSHRGIGGWGDNRSEWLEFSIPFCSDRMYWAAAWYYITFPKMLSIRLAGEWICSNVYLQLPMSSGHSPEWGQGRGDLVTLSAQSKERGSLPKVIFPRSFSARSSQLSLNKPLKALVHCIPSPYSFCNKKC